MHLRMNNNNADKQCLNENPNKDRKSLHHDIFFVNISCRLIIQQAVFITNLLKVCKHQIEMVSFHTSSHPVLIPLYCL